MLLLSTTYFGPVQWYQKLNTAEEVMLEAHENYSKQTFRNRCVIATANGLQSLTVPVERPEGIELNRCPIRDVRISDHGRWRQLHWNALQSAYSESPFFEYYADDLKPFFERHYEFLFDFNLEICNKLCELLDVRPSIRLTSEYVRHDDLAHGADDYRDSIVPKHPRHDEAFVPRPYYQVFRHKTGFLPNLSVLDLLFNMGPEGIFWLT
ncbi:MAG: WbqC family protein [Prevotella sp.]